MWHALASNSDLFKILGFTGDSSAATCDNDMPATINPYRALYHLLRPPRSLVPPPPPSAPLNTSSEQILTQQQQPRPVQSPSSPDESVWARVTRATRSLAGTLNRALGRTQFDEPRCRVAMLGPGLNGTGDHVVWWLMFDARRHFELVRLLSGSRVGSGAGAAAQGGSFGTGMALALRHPLSNAWRPTCAPANISLDTSASAASASAPEDPLVTALQEPLRPDGGDTDSQVPVRVRTFRFDLMVFFTNTYAERRRLADAAATSHEHIAASPPINKLVAASKSASVAADRTQLPDILQLQGASDTESAALHMRELCLRYLTEERDPPDQMELTPQLECILRDGCDAVVYTVDPALLTTAGAAAEARAELWAVLRAAMPDVYVHEAAAAGEPGPTATARFPAAGAAGRKLKPLLVLSLSAGEQSSDSESDLGTTSVEQMSSMSASAGVAEGVGVGVLQIARLLDIARVRTPWALVQCRVPASDKASRAPKARVRPFEFERVLAGGHRDGSGARCYREHALAPLDRAFAWLAQASSTDK